MCVRGLVSHVTSSYDLSTLWHVLYDHRIGHVIEVQVLRSQVENGYVIHDRLRIEAVQRLDGLRVGGWPAHSSIACSVMQGRDCVIVPESNNMRRVRRRVEKAVVTTTMQDDEDPVLAEGQMERRYANIGAMLQSQVDAGVGVAVSGSRGSQDHGVGRVLPSQACSEACYLCCL